VACYIRTRLATPQAMPNNSRSAARPWCQGSSSCCVRRLQSCAAAAAEEMCSAAEIPLSRIAASPLVMLRGDFRRPFSKHTAEIGHQHLRYFSCSHDRGYFRRRGDFVQTGAQQPLGGHGDCPRFPRATCVGRGGRDGLSVKDHLAVCGRDEEPVAPRLPLVQYRLVPLPRGAPCACRL
jgi:hypothetical protein